MNLIKNNLTTDEKRFLFDVISDFMDLLENINPQADELLRADMALKFLSGEMDDISYLVFIKDKTDKEAELIINK